MIYLASQSPRRAELLRQIGVQHEVYVSDIDERQEAGESPAEYVCRMAASKARVAAREIASRQKSWVVLAADTTIALDGDIIGKPQHASDCCSILRRLSAREHLVLTAVSVATPRGQEHRLCQNRVTFRALLEHEIEILLRFRGTDWIKPVPTPYRVRPQCSLNGSKAVIRQSWGCPCLKQPSYCGAPISRFFKL